jgi:hypothetical protein
MYAGKIRTRSVPVNDEARSPVTLEPAPDGKAVVAVVLELYRREVRPIAERGALVPALLPAKSVAVDDDGSSPLDRSAI